MRTNQQGTITKINQRGFGFITTSGDSLFFHVHDMEPTLGEFGPELVGRKVRFDLVDAPKGPRCVNVREDLPAEKIPSGSDYGRRLAQRD